MCFENLNVNREHLGHEMTHWCLTDLLMRSIRCCLLAGRTCDLFFPVWNVDQHDCLCPAILVVHIYWNEVECPDVCSCCLGCRGGCGGDCSGGVDLGWLGVCLKVEGLVSVGVCNVMDVCRM